MARDCEKVKEGGCTIKIGATGKVSALMMQEVESNNIKTSSKKPEIKPRKIQTEPVSIDCRGSTKRLQKMVSSNGNETALRKKKNMKHVSQQIPMLESEDLWIDKTPVRGEQRKKVTRRIVETVDLKCGKNDGDWSVTPIGNQLRRLSFSKISS
ncbi:uncharacterized protein LOC143591929 [Bidens hawaiensis]|uniref:uncharacterized protein LOC143591929 n=1 Tax=Bidens hawaiensis TaxID=980011 RepID=UPI00404921E0